MNDPANIFEDLLSKDDARASCYVKVFCKNEWGLVLSPQPVISLEVNIKGHYAYSC